MPVAAAQLTICTPISFQRLFANEPDAGGNAPFQPVSCGSGSPRAAVDASAFRLYADGKVQGDADMVFYGQPRNDDGTVRPGQ